MRRGVGSLHLQRRRAVPDRERLPPRSTIPFALDELTAGHGRASKRPTVTMTSTGSKPATKKVRRQPGKNEERYFFPADGRRAQCVDWPSRGKGRAASLLYGLESATGKGFGADLRFGRARKVAKKHSLAKQS